MKTFFTVMLLVAAAFVSGCATRTVYRELPVVSAPPALTLVQIKEMAAKGVSDETILNALRASRAVYRLTSKDVMELQEAKASQPIIDYLLSTPLLYKDDLLRSRAYYYYWPSYPGYSHWSFYDFHHAVHHYEPPHSYGHHELHSGGLHH